MKKILILLFAALSFCSVRAQHCPFDGAGIIVISIHGPAGKASIEGLEVFLCDSSGNPFSRIPSTSGSFYSFDCNFHQNPSRTTFKGYIDNNNPADPRIIRFPFAGSNYVLICSRSYDTYKAYVKVVDPQHRFFDSPAVKLLPIDVYSLCGNYDDPVYRSSKIEGRIYQPVEIQLQPIPPIK